MVTNNNISIHVSAKTNLPAAMQFWELYLKDQDRSVHTVKSFLGDLKLLEKFLPPDVEIGQISTADLNRFIEWLESGRGKGIPCSPKSLARRVTSIKSFFKWLAKSARISSDPAADIQQRTVISPLPTVLNSEEQLQVINLVRSKMTGEQADYRPYVLLKLLLETGIKKNECLNIKLNHFEINANEQYLYVRYPDQKDRNKERKLQISNDFVTAYQKYLDQYQPKENVFPWSQRRLEYILEDIGKESNLEKHLSFSMCRWNCALNDLRSGMDKNIIRQKLGVSKIQWRELEMKLNQLIKENT